MDLITVTQRERSAMELMPWLVSEAECLACNKTWIVVHELGDNDITCPACRSADTVWQDAQK